MRVWVGYSGGGTTKLSDTARVMIPANQPVATSRSSQNGPNIQVLVTFQLAIERLDYPNITRTRTLRVISARIGLRLLSGKFPAE